MKKTIKLLTLILALISFSPRFIFAQAEEKHCGTDEALKKLYEQYPELIKEHELLLENNKKFIQSKSGRGTFVYTIPIVFHVLHQYGTENISDAQLVDAVNILNRDFRGTNADTSQVVTVFKPLIADTRIEFRLAGKDKSGYCTNGIDHIYSHETNFGDDYSKLNQWARTKYLNVWVVKTMSPGVAGYAYYPSSTIGLGYFRDGIVILNNYVGSIGTSSVNNSRALTHEIGHYLNLSHTWGSTNNPGVDCGDDNIQDTPITKGHTSCQLNSQICTPGVVENVQNYMEYAYCSRMYTLDQADAMEATVNSSVAYRSSLWQASNLVATGTDITPTPLCTPLPDFSVNRNYVCMGGTITFKNQSQRAQVDTYQWSFPGGTPSTSTSANPVVVFNNSGWQNVSLTVTNAAGSETKTRNNYIYVSPASPDFFGPHSESFENSSANLWIIENPESNPSQWQVVNYGASSGSKAVGLNNMVNTTDPFYYGRLGGNKDVLISPSYNLSTTTNAILTFKYSCATRATSVASLTEALKIYSSADCGATWTLRKTLTGAALANAGFWGDNYIASAGNLWTTGTVNLAALPLQNLRFKFEYTSTDLSNNIYLDDINVEGVLSTGEISSDYFALSVYPNPSSSGIINIRYFNHGEDVTISLTDMTGRKIYSSIDNAERGEKNISINASELSLAPGVYVVNIFDGKKVQCAKVAVY